LSNTLTHFEPYDFFLRVFFRFFVFSQTKITTAALQDLKKPTTNKGTAFLSLQKHYDFVLFLCLLWVDVRDFFPKKPTIFSPITTF